MSDSDNPSSPKKEEMDVSENGDTSKTKEDSDQEDSKIKEPAQKEEPNEESEGEDDDEEPPLGLLERPVELTSGKREKKKVERLEVTINLPNAERKKVDIPEGKGTKLGECPRIEFKLNQTKAIDLKPLHRLLYNRAGSNMEVKRNIRQFNGFTFTKGDKEYEKRVTSLNKLTLAGLKHVCEVLDIERGGTKSAIVERIMDFLMKPSSSGLRVPQKKKSE
ncbi:protein DEK-like [Babylonia areolata]|uniref:protein DEK-like n=1 Tax=Babylonia areolata TaxID=304850 RepID=UPI003FD0AC31